MKKFDLLNIESDFREQRLSAIAKRNNTNRKRARAMEQRIAKRLGGKRVPLSGAGSIKGDVFANSRFGMYIVECKLSEQWSKPLNCATLPITATWLTKIMQEAKYMNASFGILIFHYHGTKNDFVIIHEEDFSRMRPSYIDEEKVAIIKNNKVIGLHLPQVKDMCEKNGYFMLITSVGSFAVMSLDYFEELIKDDQPI